MNDSIPVESKRWIGVLRWICVLPAALVASWLLGGVADVLLSRLGVELRESGYPAYLFPLLQRLPSGIAFTFVGGLVAPRMKPATATALAALCIPLSLLIHVFGQSNPGLTNYMHTTGESLGALIGVAAIIFRTRP